MISHRGVHDRFPENSVAAIQAAIELGADGVEIDLRRTRDGVIVVMHDDRVGTTRVADCSYSELLQSVPSLATLEEALAAVGHRSFVDLELKEAGFEAEALEAASAGLRPDGFMISSFLGRSLRNVARIALQSGRRPGPPTGLLVGGSASSRGLAARLGERLALERVRWFGANVLLVHQRLANRSLLRRAVQRSVPVMVWTVNEEALLRRFLSEPAVAGVITDRLELASQISDSLARRS
ncbi:MAG: glycerophosphodiester phosphodiesterase [Acidobacteriota bacterium]